MKLASPVAALALLTLCPYAAASAGQPFVFDPAAKSLTITTPALQLTIQGGAVVALKDLRTREVFSDGAAWEDLAKSRAGAVCGEEPVQALRAGREVSRNTRTRKPVAASTASFTPVSPREGLLVYTGLTNGPAEDELRLGFRLEDRGELSFRVELRLHDPAAIATHVALPFVNLQPTAIISGCGTRFARRDPPGEEVCMRIASNIYSPPVGVIEGARGVIGLWPEPVTFGYDDLIATHTTNRDALVPEVALPFQAKDPETANEPGVTRSSWWRLAALPAWLNVAKRYRASLERRTGAKPLWLQDPAWVRDIHAVCSERPNTTNLAVATAFYTNLAARLDPKKLLLFYWNGNSIVLFGDHRLMSNLGYPKPEEIAALSQQGFRWMGYHPYVLIYSPTGAVRHLADTRVRGFGVPDGYTFQPDYAGPPTFDAFVAYFRPYSCGYYGKLDGTPELWTPHPGVKVVRDYLARNLGGYCRAHGASGCYLDILGADHSGQYLENAPEDRRIMEGNDWRRGEYLACQAMKAANPDLALMSEVEGDWTTTCTFYTWEGESHLTHPTPVRLNHPMRAACWGSYTSTKTESPEAVALLAGLPPAARADDWSMARAKLYIDEELFNDLPDRWDPAALAYYRGKGGRWFQYRQMPWGYAYVELRRLGADRVRLGRFSGVADCPVPAPVRVQDWAAYRAGKPIGLNPAQAYNFIKEAAQSNGRLWLTDLPPHVVVTAIRHADGQSVIELGATNAAPARVKVLFQARCLSVLDATREYPGPYEAGATAEFTTPAPGGLVFQWQPAKLAKAPYANPRQCFGHVQANGIPYDFWTYNSGVVDKKAFALSSNTPPVAAFELGPGLHRGWSDQWVDLTSNAQPVLRFDSGYAPAPRAESRPRTVVGALRVNGTEIWREVLKSDPAWRPREVSLPAFAGRKVLLTLSVEENTTENVHPSHLAVPVHFSNVRLESK